MKVKIGSFTLCFMILLLATAGCSTAKVKTNEFKARSIENRVIHNGNTTRSLNYPNAVDRTKSAPSDHVTAKQIEKEIAAIKGVDKHTVIVHNRNAIIGLDVKAGHNAAVVAKQIKQKAEQVGKGYTIHVTSDKSIHSRIQNMSQQMVPLDGHPVRNFTEDVGIIIRDIGRTVTAPFR
ncbi:YhcN/YlaJ family sporulation lipoprotein [Paenibacillus sp. YIM B09110]|uniref:YhcN/YlaJ family sporulation lipoprotein n=1 Tax=Paenibacillus sp. YIM B09110 TaxID=3126102 RepID=UPI00301BEC6F